MLRKILVIMIAAQIAIQPAIAQTLPPMTQKQEQKFCHAIMGWDDVIFIGIFVLLVNMGWSNFKKSEEIEKLKAEAKQRCGA